jgi:antitoxin component YwqK of YwqJK toxin-antitoxin module
MLLCIAASVFTLRGQESIKLEDIKIINLGDGKLYATLSKDKDTPIDGKVRMITGYTTEYTDAEFTKGYATGEWKYFKNNVPVDIRHYADGLLNGEVIEYYDDGKAVKTKGAYKAGQKDGLWESFKRDGVYNSSEEFANGKVVRRITYYTDNSVSTETTFNAEGKKHGVEKEYAFDGGYLVREQNFVNGKLLGKQKRRISSNQVGYYYEYAIYNEAGKKDGEFVELYEDDKTVKSKGLYVNDKKDGKWTYGFPNSKIPGKEEVYENGVLKSRKEYVTGFGNKDNYFERRNYNAREQLDGEYTEIWEKGGKTKTKGQYVQGRKQGTWTQYDVDGKAKEEAVYENGNEVSSKKFDK